MKPSDTELAKLLAQTLHDDWETGDPLRYAQHAAKYARRRRARRHLVAIAACVLLLAASLVTMERVSPSSRLQIGGARSNYTVLSDAELLAQVHDRPLFALRKGDQITKVVVLENASSEPAPGSEQ